MNKTDTITRKTGEVATMLGVKPYTVTRYAKKFSSHLSAGATRKHRQFTPGDIDILKRVQRLMGDGHTQNEINTILASQDRQPETPPAEIARQQGDIIQYFSAHVENTLAPIIEQQDIINRNWDEMNRQQETVNARTAAISAENVQLKKQTEILKNWVIGLGVTSVLAAVLAIVALAAR